MDYTNAFAPSPAGKPVSGIDAFDSTTAAPEFSPLPAGVYQARVARGELTTTKSGHDGYRLRFTIVEGAHTGRVVYRTWSFSERALPYARRDLQVLGLHTSAQLREPFPPPGHDVFVKLWVVLQQNDSGGLFNDVRRIELIRTTASPITNFLLPQ